MSLNYLEFEIFDGVSWLSLNDQINYRVSAESFATVQQSRRRHMVESSMYDGEWEVHSTLSNVTEMVVVDVMGVDQNHVTENLLRLTEAATTQALFSARKTMDNHRETWRCFPAEWSLDRGHVQSHAVRAKISLSIPRFPKVTYEVVE